MLPSTSQIINKAIASTNQTSAPISAMHIINMSVQAVVTGASTGTVKVQFSNDSPGGLPTNWNDIPTATVATAGAGSFSIPIFDVCYVWVRFAYTVTAGAAGVITVSYKSNGF